MNTPQEEVESLLRQMRRAAKDPIRMKQVSDEILTLCTAYMLPAEEVTEICPGVHLQPAERRIFGLLLAKKGLCVSKDALTAAASGKSWDLLPDSKIVDIRVCGLRKKLLQANAPYEIETIWGQGYRLKSKPVAVQQEARAA